MKRAAAVAFLCLMSALFGGSFVLLVHAQSLPSQAERTRAVEVGVQQLTTTVEQNSRDIAELRSDVSVMTGVGLAIAAMAGILQVIQMVGRAPQTKA